MERTSGERVPLDLRGKTITTYIVYEAAKVLEGMSEGEQVELLTDDFEPIEADLASWTRLAGHALERPDRTEDGLRFRVTKGRPIETLRELAVVISDPGLEDLLTPLGFALAAGLEGVRVHLFFQGPAVRVLKRGFIPRLHGWARPFSAFARRGLARVGHVHPQEKLAEIRDLGGHIYVCGPSMEHFKVRKEELVYPDLPVVEYLTFMEIMSRPGARVYVQ
ncbi:MAG TPA: DsrE family protein [Actinomycetota bacterium]|nr:DsrE family protein [Actinomycetota bacterium]